MPVHHSYDFRPDVAELEKSLGGLYDDVTDDIIEDVPFDKDEVEERDQVYQYLNKQVAEINYVPIKARQEYDPEVIKNLNLTNGDVVNGLPFLLTLGLMIANSKTSALRGGTEQVYKDLSLATDKRYEVFRKKSKGIDSNTSLFPYAERSVASIPTKIQYKQVGANPPFSIKFNVNFDAQWSQFNRKAHEYLFGKDFKIKTQTITENLKKRLQSSLASGYANGDDRSTMVSRVKSVLGDKSNASTIAITEVADAANFGEYEFANEYRERFGVEVLKTWYQLIRASARKSHKAVAGTTLKFNERFTVDGEEMMRPHDPGASANNVINCGCYCEYETGQSILKPTQPDERGIRNYISEVEKMPAPEPYFNAERIGAFVNPADAAKYMQDIYGISVDDEFALDEMNIMADTMDVMPYEQMKSNMKLTNIIREDLAENELAVYSLEHRSIFIDPKSSEGGDFGWTVVHEIGHSIHYSAPEFFKEFADLAWENVGGGNIFEASNWKMTKPLGVYLDKQATKNVKEHFAEMVSWYVTRNADLRELALRIRTELGDDTVMKIVALFDKYFGPVNPQ